MKNKLWKSMLTAIALCCSTLTNPMAMDNGEPAPNTPETVEKTRQVRLEQNQDYARSLFTDMIVKEGKSFQEYMQACSTANVTPFVPAGLFPSQTKVVTNEDIEIEFKKTYANLKAHQNDPREFVKVLSCPAVNVFDVFSSHLLPKYLGVVRPQYSKTKLKINKSSRKEVFYFLDLHKDDIESVGDPNLWIIFMRMLSAYPQLKGHTSYGLDQWALSSITYPESKPILYWVSGVKNKKVCFDMDSFCNRWRGSIEGIYLHNLPASTNLQAVKQQIWEGTAQGIDQIFNILGKQHYQIQEDGIALSDILGNWFNIARQLIHFELAEWEERAGPIKKFKKDYKWVVEKLTEVEKGKNTYYSGVAISPFSISLIQTGEKSKAESPTTLKQFAHDHYLSHEEEIQEYNTFKERRSTLEKAQEWFDEIFGAVGKRGRFS